MPNKKRVAIPTKARNQVLKEFRHLCALCGTTDPQVHHIDENPENNEPDNLLPLCPNCHLTDHHNPTARIDIKKLQLFRQYKDPAILDHRFEPLFRRLRFLDEIHINSDIKRVKEQITELVSFVKSLQMGDFYALRLVDLLNEPTRFYATSIYGANAEEDRKRAEDQLAHRDQLCQARDEVYSLAVELLRYQNWEHRKRS